MQKEEGTYMKDTGCKTLKLCGSAYNPLPQQTIPGDEWQHLEHFLLPSTLI